MERTEAVINRGSSSPKERLELLGKGGIPDGYDCSNREIGLKSGPLCDCHLDEKPPPRWILEGTARTLSQLRGTSIQSTP